MKNDLVLFFLAILFGALSSFVWIHVGESWGIFGDADHYVKLYQGQVAEAPFGYRVLTPVMAKLLPWDMVSNFASVSIFFLILTSGVVALYARNISKSLATYFIIFILWCISYPFVYYSTAFVRVDAPMLFLLAVGFFASQRNLRPLFLGLLISVGVLAHEMMLILLVALWVDKFFSSDLSGGAQYSFAQLINITVFSFGMFLCCRALINIEDGVGVSYVNGLFGMVSYVRGYNGSWFNHGLKIYAAYGPVLLYAFFYVAPWNAHKRSVSFFVLFLCSVLLTLMATDTLRVMAILFVPVLFFASSFISYYLTSRNYVFGFILLAMQGLYSFIVFGHLRSFESSPLMNKAVALLSVFALLFCISIEFFCNERFRRRLQGLGLAARG